MKRFIAILAVVALGLALMAGCGKKDPTAEESAEFQTEVKSKMAMCGKFKVPAGAAGSPGSPTGKCGVGGGTEAEDDAGAEADSE